MRTSHAADCRSPMGADPGRIDWPTVRSGTIPWTVAAFADAARYLEALRRLRGLDQRVWSQASDLAGVAVGSFDPSISNPDNLDGDVAVQVLEQCVSAGLDRTATASHIWRMTEIRCFVASRFQQLSEAGLIRTGNDGRELLEPIMVGALVRLPYTAIRHRLDGGGPGLTFDVRVLIEAVEASRLAASHANRADGYREGVNKATGHPVVHAWWDSRPSQERVR